MQSVSLIIFVGIFFYAQELKDSKSVSWKFCQPKTEFVHLGRDPHLHFKNSSSNFSSHVHGFSSLRNELLLETNKLMPATRKGETSFFVVYLFLDFPWAKTSRRNVASFYNNLRRIFSLEQDLIEKNLPKKRTKRNLWFPLS